MKNLIKYCFIVLLSCAISCQRANTTSPTIEKNGGLVLSAKQIVEMLSLVKPYEDKKFNIHVRYSDRFNDSTLILEIVQNQFLPNRKGICETIKYKENSVFIYDSLRCNMNLSDSLTSDANGVPFFVNDSPYWAVLVKRRQGNLLYYNVSMIPVYDESLKKDTMPW